MASECPFVGGGAVRPRTAGVGEVFAVLVYAVGKVGEDQLPSVLVGDQQRKAESAG